MSDIELEDKTISSILRVVMTGNIDMTKVGFQLMANSKDIKDRRIVAINPNTPIDILEKLVNDKDVDVRTSLAINPNTPIEILGKLSNDKDISVRCRVAEETSLLIILEKLSTDKDVAVRESVAHNPNTPANILEKLSTDKRCFVRYVVAHNPNTPIEILKKLLNDKEKGVRNGVITHHPNLIYVSDAITQLLKLRVAVLKNNCKK